MIAIHVPRDQWTNFRGTVSRITDEDAWQVNAGHVRAGYSPEQLRTLAVSAGFCIIEEQLWLRRWGAFAFAVYARLEHPTPLRALSIPLTDACAYLDRSRPADEGNTVWLVGEAG